MVLRYADGDNVSFAGVEADSMVIFNDALNVDGSNFTINGDKARVDLYKYEPSSIFVKRNVDIRYDATREDNGTVNFTHNGLPETGIEFRVDKETVETSSSGTITTTVTDWSTKEIEIGDFLDPNFIQKFLQVLADTVRGWFTLGSLDTGQQILIGLTITVTAGGLIGLVAGSSAAIAIMMATLIIWPVVGLWPTWIVFLVLVVVGLAALLKLGD